MVKCVLNICLIFGYFGEEKKHHFLECTSFYCLKIMSVFVINLALIWNVAFVMKCLTMFYNVTVAFLLLFTMNIGTSGITSWLLLKIYETLLEFIKINYNQFTKNCHNITSIYNFIEVGAIINKPQKLRNKQEITGIRCSSKWAWKTAIMNK